MPPQNDEIRKETGEKFRKARLKLRLTQAEVAALAGVHVNFYARIEQGKENPSLERLHDIMKVLKIKSLELL